MLAYFKCYYITKLWYFTGNDRRVQSSGQALRALYNSATHGWTICRAIYILFKSNCRYFKSNLKSNRDLLNRIAALHIESPSVFKSRFYIPNRDRDLPITATVALHMYHIFVPGTAKRLIKPRLHDTTCCQTGLTTGCIVYTNIQPVVKPDAKCIVVTAVCVSVCLCDCPSPHSHTTAQARV